MARYDYRNDYKGWTKEEMVNYLPILLDKLLANIGICESNAADYSKRHSYLKNKIKK